MQSGDGAAWRAQGLAVALPPLGLSSSSACASPSSSSSAVSAPKNSGSESLSHHHQQLLITRQQQQLLQVRKPEQDNILADKLVSMHGVISGSNFLSSPAIPVSNFSRNLQLDYSRQLYENKQSGHVLEKQHNLMHHSYAQFSMHTTQSQQKSHGSIPMQIEGEFGMMGPPTGRHQILAGNTKKEENIPAETGNQAQLSKLPTSADHIRCNDNQNELVSQKNELQAPKPANGQFAPANVVRPFQSPQSQGSVGSIVSNQLMLAQLQAMQAWAIEHNIDLSHPANSTLIAQVLPILQSNRLAALHKPNSGSTPTLQPSFSASKPQISISSPASSENSAQGNSIRNLKSQPGLVRSGVGTVVADLKNMKVQQAPPGDVVQSPQHLVSLNQSFNPSIDKKLDSSQVQSFSQQSLTIGHPTPQTTVASLLSHRGLGHIAQQHVGFTKQQLHVLKAQILAFRRLKRGEIALPPEVLQSITPPSLEFHPQAPLLSPKTPGKQEKIMGQTCHKSNLEENSPQLLTSNKNHTCSKEGGFVGDEKTAAASSYIKVDSVTPRTLATIKALEAYPISVKSEQDADQDCSFIGENDTNKGKSVTIISASVDAGPAKKHLPENVGVPSNAKMYNGPLFDTPFYVSKYDILGSTMKSNPNNYTFAYDINDLLDEEGKEVLKKKRTMYLKKLGNLLASNLGRKKIKPDLVLRLQIEEKKLRLWDIQLRLREEVDEQQQEIMAMPDRPYRKFVRQCERQRSEFLRQMQHLQKAAKEKHLKAIFQWRKKLLESHWAIRDARTAHNRGVAKYHEKMLREFSKRKDDGRNKRFQALKNNDVDRYREILLEQQTSIPGDAAQRYAVLSSFLSQTEAYLYKLGTKISTLKKQQDVDEAANAAATSARYQGLSEGEAKAIVACAREEAMIRNTFSEMNTPKDGPSVNKYYNLAHAVNERVLKQPSMLQAGTLRDYQLVGLQWMVSLYNNKLNGILADEMGLGKTVQVMSLIAYLMEFKGNYGPHLIIVPNAVLVNWKSELHHWLPSALCIYYVGAKDERSRLFFHEICALKFNVLVTTYEFIMYDRSRLSRIDWKYIIIDEAQRMKDRESVLARDLDRYRCQRRLLLTGTPLQNDLKELWSLLNLLLPEVFDNKKSFHDWFSKPFQKDGPSHTQEEDDWLETEKKVIVIHRLHQILEPFMLRRRVEDVEGSLPPKVSVVLRCRMSALQGAIYDWIKSTGTIRVDPDDELRKAERNPAYQIKMFKNLNNKCMELRKACNHPLLNYPYFSDYSKEFLIRSCGKLWILDRILLKLYKAGHRVLLFSTMTKLLDILEEYLQWRQLVYRRIDGSTSLEDRESAIVDFNSPSSKCFLFLLSIRAAGRGLNLQSADTVVIYDPDPNPQNEEQAVARAHRIGQTREVKVIYMEAVADKISSYQKDDDLRNGGRGDSEDNEFTGKHRYMGSIESLIRDNIQQYKIDMADEVINAGRFDQRTTHEERRMTLETLLRDEERYQETIHDVPSLSEVNRMIARSDEEVELFDQMDAELNWTREMTKHSQVPMWLRAGSKELNAVIARLNKKMSKNIFGSVADIEYDEMFPGLATSKKEKRKGRPNSIKIQKYSSYVEYDDDEDFDTGSYEGNEYSLQEEDREIEYMENEDLISGVADLQGNSIGPLEEGQLVCNDDGGYEFSNAIEGSQHNEAGSSGSSFGNRRVQQPISSSPSLRKFGFLSELDARSDVLLAKKNELEEGEIAVSGDSRIQQSGSWNHGRYDGEYEQVIQPILKRKRSKRLRPGHATERMEEKFDDCMSYSQHEAWVPTRVHHDNAMNIKIDGACGPFLGRHGLFPHILKHRSNFQTRRDQVTNSRHNSVGSSYLHGCQEVDNSRESWNGSASNNAGLDIIGRNMSDSMQRKCKNVISKLQRRIEKEGCQLVPLLYDLWKKNDSLNPTRKYSKENSFFNLWIIDHRVDNLEYSGVADFITDFQSMLKNAVQFCKYSHEAKYEARKLQDIFFHIMKIAFPDSDFHDEKMALTFPNSSHARIDVTPRLKPCMEKHSFLKPPTRTHNLKPNPQSHDEVYGRFNNSARVEKDASFLGPLLTHPGDLVICKKKRKDRDKALVRPKLGILSPTNSGLPSSFRQMVSKNEAVIKSPANKEFVLSVKHTPDWDYTALRDGEDIGHVASGMEELQWARPVKRVRSDTGKRRPNNL